MKRLAMLALAVAACHAAAQPAFPQKPVRMVVAFTAGSETDYLARIVGQKLGENLGQQVVIDNRPGANGNIGTDIVAKSPPDGYTIVMAFDGTIAINPSVYAKLPFDPQADLAPIANVARVALLLVTHPSVPATNIAQFVAHAKSAPGKINYSSAGPGSTGHLTGELLKTRAGFDMVHIAYKGGGQAVQDLLAGRIQALFTGVPTVEEHIKTGKLRAIAFSTAKRVAQLPDVPTLAESGYADFDVASWYGLFAPAKTPGEVINRLNAAALAVLAQADTRQRFAALGTEAGGGTPMEFAETVKRDTERWAGIVKAVGIRLD